MTRSAACTRHGAAERLSAKFLPVGIGRCGSRGSGPRVVSFGGSVLLVKTATATPGGWWRRTSR